MDSVDKIIGNKNSLRSEIVKLFLFTLKPMIRSSLPTPFKKVKTRDSYPFTIALQPTKAVANNMVDISKISDPVLSYSNFLLLNIFLVYAGLWNKILIFYRYSIYFL